MRISVCAWCALAGWAAPAAATLSTGATYSGNVEAVVTGFAGTSGYVSPGGIPFDATIVSATLYTNSWFDTDAMASATFEGKDLGSVRAFDSDGTAGKAFAYKWDVTGLVTGGDGPYDISVGGASQMYGAALAIVFSHPSLPAATVYLNEGVTSVGELGPDSRSTTFAGVGAAGPGRLQIYTQADDTATSGEEILFNGSVVGGPIDQGLGSFASLFDIDVTTQLGDNTAMLTSQGDWYGWHVATLTTGIPGPGTAGVFALGALAAARRRR